MALVSALGAGVVAVGTAGAPQPPNLTGTWTTTGGVFVLTASGPALNHLHAEWHGTAARGHPTLAGRFDGTLNAARNAYNGSMVVQEGGNAPVTGTMTWTIDSPTL